MPGGLLRNNHLQFRCEIVELQVENNDSPFTRGYQRGQTIRIPIAHGEGRYYADEETLAELSDRDRIAFRYVNNPNGSLAGIAGILNARGNVLGMMPHPERAVIDWMGSADGAALFASMHQFAEEVAYAR